jgi:hypothetical protein
MSYVIQNFSDFNKKVNLTPRFKFIFIFNNLEKFFIFLKLNTFLNMSNNLNYNNLNYYNIFFKYLFSKQFIKFLFQLNLNLIGNYTNNITKSSIYGIFFNLNNFFNLNKIYIRNKLHIKNYLFNLYFLPIKTLNIRINNNFYKNIFFYFMIINPFL